MKKSLTKKPGYKIGLYVRVSTEEQAENPEGSIKNQEQRLRDYVRLKNADGPFGEIKEVFCDPGISAKDMNRPALQRMLSLIRAGGIDLVLVTEISRLSRSIKDFTHLWEFLKDNSCEFQSLRDNFDTTTPAGEMILFTLANFAQFERRQLGERIQNSFQARAQRGLWNGGVLPLGYEVDPEKPGHLKVIPEEAKIVDEIFKTFLKEETLAKTGKVLNDKPVKLPRLMRKGGSVRHSHFTIENVHCILTNRAYIAKRVFKTKDGVKEVRAVWPAIIDDNRFNRVQEMLAKNKSQKKAPSETRYPYLLSGLVICAKCGDRLCGKSAHGNGGKVGYYEHAWSVKTQSCMTKKVFDCAPNRIPAKVLEPQVWADVRKILFEEWYAKEIFAEAKKIAAGMSGKAEVEKLKAKSQGIALQIEAVTERITQLPKEIDAKLFYDQIVKLQKAKTEVEGALQSLQMEANHEKTLSFDDFSKFVPELVKLTKDVNPNMQAAICRRLIDRIEVNADDSTIRFTIFYHVGENHYRSHFKDALGGPVIQPKGPAGEQPSGPVFISKPLFKYNRTNAIQKILSDGSNSLKNGSERRT